MQEGSLFSIGHGTRQLDGFLALLQAYQVRYLADVRSRPFSRFNPQYNQPVLREMLALHGIRYVFMGDSLGGRPKDPLCYDNHGKVDYDVLKTKDYFLKGIDRLKAANDKGLRVALMCSETGPLECHRSRLIGRVLYDRQISLQHILATGELIAHEALMNRLQKPDQPDTGLFSL